MKIGHVHGRFQPFHNKHAEYVRWAAADCDTLLVGLTNADPSHVEEEHADPKRHRPEHNPFVYHERYSMIRAYVQDADLPCDVEIMPFPVNKPSLWEYYVPESAIHYLEVLEEWHEVKKRRFEEMGRTVVTREKEKPLSATEIRQDMRDGRAWESKVPDPVVDVIHSIDGVERVRELFAER